MSARPPTLRGRQPASASIGARPGSGRARCGLLPLIALVLVAWEALARSGTSSPPSCCRRYRWCSSGSGDDTLPATCWSISALTLYRALVGFAIAAVAGVALGILMARNNLVRWFFDPIVSVGVPDAEDRLPADLHAVVRPLRHLEDLDGRVQRDLPGDHRDDRRRRRRRPVSLWSARSLGASERQLLREIILPAALPQILTGLQIALPISLIVAIVTEMLMGGPGSAAR